MIRRLPLQTKLLIAFTIPLLAIVLVALVALDTFQTVKVNGPQYNKIANAKDLEADILPPPGYLVETQLVALTVIDEDRTAIEYTPEQVKSEFARHRREFEEIHIKWQKYLPENTRLKNEMREAYIDGRRYFQVIDAELLPEIEKILDPNSTGLQQSLARFAAADVFANRLSPIYKTHREHIVEAVKASQTRQTTIERTSRRNVDNQLRALGVVIIAVLVVSTLIALLSARSISRPIKRLTATALNTAEHELPEALAEIQAGAPKSSVAGMELAKKEFGGEIGGLIRAFQKMRATSIDLAGDQALIRRNVSNNLVNIARRNQVLLKRTLSSISVMERDERDAAKLEQLFELDHLTTRMRRNAESLLVLADADNEGPKLWTAKLTVGDTVRSALSQIEMYGRVELGHFDTALVRGSAVTDVAHLVAEFLENATHFSPPETTVTVGGRLRLDGYVISINDEGVGMSPDALTEANRRLASPAEFIAEPTKVLGLAVAGHLANRHGLDVSLSENVLKGVTVRVHIPLELIITDVPVEEGYKDTGTSDRPGDDGSTSKSKSDEPRASTAPVPNDPVAETGPVSSVSCETNSTTGLPMRKRKAADGNVEAQPLSDLSGAAGSNGLAKRVRGATLRSSPADQNASQNASQSAQQTARTEWDPNSVRNALASLQGGTRSAEKKIKG